MGIFMPAAVCKTAKSEMYSLTALPIYGFVKWNNTAITENLKNAPNVNCWRIAAAVLRLPAAGAGIFMRQTRSAGKRCDHELI